MAASVAVLAGQLDLCLVRRFDQLSAQSVRLANGRRACGCGCRGRKPFCVATKMRRGLGRAAQLHQLYDMCSAGAHCYWPEAQVSHPHSKKKVVLSCSLRSSRGIDGST